MWKSTEIEFLKENYTSLGAKACAKSLGRTREAVFVKARRIGLSNRKNIVIDGFKRCSKCGNLLPLEAFHRSANFKSGYNSSCRACWQYYCRKHAKVIYPVRKKYREDNKEQLQIKKRQYNLTKSQTDPIWRMRKNLRRRVHHALHGHCKSAATLELVGCSIKILKTHLERQFQVGMSWDNYGKEWHIDHIRPCASFDLSLAEQQKLCFHFSNLQPLWSIDNLRKGQKLKF